VSAAPSAAARPSARCRPGQGAGAVEPATSRQSSTLKWIHLPASQPQPRKPLGSWKLPLRPIVESSFGCHSGPARAVVSFRSIFAARAALAGVGELFQAESRRRTLPSPLLPADVEAASTRLARERYDERGRGGSALGGPPTLHPTAPAPARPSPPAAEGPLAPPPRELWAPPAREACRALRRRARARQTPGRAEGPASPRRRTPASAGRPRACPARAAALAPLSTARAARALGPCDAAPAPARAVGARAAAPAGAALEGRRARLQLFMLGVGPTDAGDVELALASLGPCWKPATSPSGSARAGQRHTPPLSLPCSSAPCSGAQAPRPRLLAGAAPPGAPARLCSRARHRRGLTTRAARAPAPFVI
jgi:hypothetical protein